MARIKKYSPQQNLSSFQTFIVDDNPNSDYFRITEFKDTFTGGKNGFLIEGSEYLKESTEIKIELLDVNGDPIYYEPGNGVPEYYEGVSKLVAVYIYNDTPIGLGKITILGELKQYDDNGVKRDVPEQWKGAYNVKWERTFQINKNLANEDKVRFYRRPKVQIDEIVKPIFSKTPNLITQSGSVDGTPLVPGPNSKLSNFSLPTSYRITTADENYWTGSVVGQTLNIPDIGYTTTIQDVVSKTELVVDPPYAPNDIVSSFSSQNYSVNFVYLEGVSDLATALTGSFAKIKITDMNTFVGDAARVKVFRRSQSQLSDYEFVQEIQLESNEVLRDIETTNVNQLNYGQFTEDVIQQYWVTSSNDLTIQLNQDFLYNSIKFNSTDIDSFFTSQSFDISSGVEYTLTFNVRKKSNTSGDDYIKAFLGSTPGPVVEDLTGAIACSTAATYTGGESYPTQQTVNLGENTGTTNLQYNAVNVPDRFIVEWDGSVVIDSGYVGGTAFDFGGASRSTFTAGLLGEVDPITGNTYPDLTTYPDDGYPRVTTASAPLPNGSGSLSFNKTTSSPQLATVSVYAPLGGTAWDFTLNCPQDPPVSGVSRISNPTTTQTITTVQSSNGVLQKTPIEINFLADDIDDVRLYFEIVGSEWYISDVSLKASQETSFSPDVITFIQQVPKTLPAETFDYRFEFYDINNNYIPVLVEETKTFDGGNLNLFEKSIELVPDQLYFAFDSASNPLPPTVINFEVNTTLVTGSVTFTSESYDFFGNFISASEYAGGGQYPGLLNDINTDEPFLTVTNFTGSLLPDSKKVQFIKYTAEVEGVSDSVIITRVQDGQGGVNFEIRPYRGTIIKNKSDNDIELQALRIDGVNEIILKDNLPQDGFSDAKLRILSGSTYYLLSDAVDNSIIRGVSAGLTGSGEINYNARFNRDAIDGELTVFLMDGDAEANILTSLKLTDLLDGLGSGFVNFSAEQFSLQPRLDTSYNPITASVTASFQERGVENSFISGCLMITPSASIDVDYVTHYYMFYETGAFDRRVTVTATDLLDNPVYSGIPGQSVAFYTAPETKQLTLNFTYLEDITSASVSVDKTFYIVPEGKPGDDAIVIDVEPKIIQLSANQKGEVYTYKPMDTDISIKQGRLDLLFSDAASAGTFNITNITATGITEGTTSAYNEYSASITDFDGMPRNVLSGSVKYDLQIHPYFTSSFFTQSIVQKVTKAVDGADAVDVLINPVVVNFSGDETGVVNDVSDANTTINVKQGDEYLIFSSSGEPGTFTASFTTRNIQPTLISSSNDFDSSGDDTLQFLNFGQMEYTTASVVYDITAYPYSLASGLTSSFQRFRRTQLFTKANAGAVARSVKLSASTTTVNYDGDGTQLSPEGPVILTANAFGLTGSAYFQFLLDGFPYTLISTDELFEIGSGDTPPPGEISTWTVTLRDGSPDAGIVAQDSITIAGIKSGGDSYTVELENNNVSVPFEVDGTGDFSGTGTTIRAYKGSTELTHVSSYSAQTLDPLGDPIGTLGEYSASLFSVSSWITQPNIPTGNPAAVGSITSWTNPTTNQNAEIVFKVDVENGRAVFFKTQSFAVSFEGAVGPGIVFRGEYTGSIDYQYSVTNGRRDAVIYDKTGDGLAETYYIILQPNGPGSTVVAPEGDVDSAAYWEELGTEDLFVAAEIGIFGESFVKNTINVGMPPPDNQNANIAIVGGTDEPYIAIGQSGTQGYAQQGIFLGLTNDGGPIGTSGTFGIMSLSGDPTAPSYKGLFWDGETLTIRGSIRQTDAGAVEPALRGTWTQPVIYNELDSVIYNGQSWSANTAHTSSAAGNSGPPGTGIYWDASSGTGKTVTLSSDSFVITYDAYGNNPSPSGNVKLMASSSNFIDPYFKFTGGITGGDESTYTNGADDDYDSATFTVPSTIFTTPLQFRVGVSEGDQNEVVSDVINVFAIQPGADSTPMYFITSIAGGTQIKNSSGTIELQVQKSDSTGLSDITSGTDARIYDGATLLAAQTGVTDGGNGVEYNPIIASSFINGTKTLTLKDNGGSVLDTITLVDVTDGLGGGSFISPNLSTNRDTTTNVYTPTFLSLTASFYDTSGTEYTKAVRITPNYASGTDYMYYDNNASEHTDSEITLTLDDGDGTTFSGTGIGNKLPTKDVVVTAVFTDPATGQTNTIVETLYIVSDGVDGLDGITVISTNQAHTLPADSAGNVSSYAGSGTKIEVYEGATKLLYDGGIPPSDGEWSIGNIIATNITTGTGNFGSDYAEYGNHSSMTANQASIRYGITGSRANGTEFKVDTIQTFTKAVAGENGTSGINGTNGAAGTPSGIVYAGAHDTTGNYNTSPSYLAEAQLKYVVKDGSNYYVCKLTHRYRGTWNTTRTYDVDDVVLESGTYYIVNSPVASGGGAPSTDPGEYDTLTGNSVAITNTNLWESFGAQFTSVATDILFAEDVYANKTINIGTNDNTKPVIALNADADGTVPYSNPYIAIGQDVQGFTNDGVFIGYSGGNPVLSFVTGSVGRSTYMIYESGSLTLSDANFLGTGSVIRGSALQIGRNTDYSITSSLAYNMSVNTDGFLFAQDADIRGTINALDGQIGDWQITQTQIVSSNENIILDADDESITVFDGSGNVKFEASTDANLPTIQASSAVTVTVPTTTFNTQSIDGSPSTVTGTDDLTLQVGGSNTFTVSTPGKYVGTFNHNNTYTKAFAEGEAFASMNLRLIITNASDTPLYYGSVYSVYAQGTAEYVGGGGGIYSVLPNTEITLSDGSTKLAKDVTSNDKLLVWDEVNQSFVEASTGNIETSTKDSYLRIHLEDRIIEVTNNHGFWYDGGVEIKAWEFQPNDFIYIKDGNTISRNRIIKIEEIKETTEVYTFTVPKYENYITNGLISHNALGDYFTTSETDSLGSVNFTITAANLATGTNYKIKWRRVYTCSSFNPASAPWEDSGLNFEGSVYARLSTTSTTFPLTLLSAGTYVTQAGFQSVTDGTTGLEKYIRHKTTAVNTTGDYNTDIGGGLGIDALFGNEKGPFSTRATSNNTFNAPGYPHAIKGGALINISFAAIDTSNPTEVVAMSFGCFDSIASTNYGRWNVTIDTQTGDGSNTNGKWFGMVGSGVRLISGGGGDDQQVGLGTGTVQSNSASGTANIQVWSQDPSATSSEDQYSNMARLNFIIIA